MGQVQGMIDALEGRVLALEEAPAEEKDEAAGYDDEELQRKVRDLEAANRALLLEVDRLKREFPVHRFAKVVSTETDYMVCSWFFPVEDVDGPEFYCCYPPGADAGGYDVDQVIMVVPSRSWADAIDPTGKYITWMENSGGGGGTGGYYVWIAASEALLPGLSDGHRGELGYTDNYDKPYILKDGDPNTWERLGNHRVHYNYTVGTLPSGAELVKAGDHAIVEDGKLMYTPNDGTTWWCISHTREDV